MVGNSVILLDHSTGMQYQKIHPARLEQRQQRQDLVRIVVPGPDFNGEGTTDGIPQSGDDLGNIIRTAEHPPTGQAAAHPAIGAAHVEVDMRSAGFLRDLGRQNQRLALITHQLHHQRHTLLLGGDIPQVSSGKPRPCRCSIDAHEFGKNDVGPDMLDKISAQSPVGQTLHRRQHQRCGSGLPREHCHAALTVSGVL